MPETRKSARTQESAVDIPPEEVAYVSDPPPEGDLARRVLAGHSVIVTLETAA